MANSFLCRLLQYIVLLIFCLLINIDFLFAQYSYGSTGLLHTPSADMQKDKNFFAGFGLLNEQLTPPRFNYNTYNYYLGVTIFPCLEVSYVCTLFKVTPTWGVPSQMGKFTNQDRYFALKLRIIKEGQFWKYMPAVAIGTSDPFTEAGDGTIGYDGGGNGFFSRFYVSTTKYISIKNEYIGVHLSYLYNRRTDYKLNGLAGGITYSPSFCSDLKFITEYDSRDILFGANYLFFNHLLAQAMIQKGKYFSGGLTYFVHLK